MTSNNRISHPKPRRARSVLFAVLGLAIVAHLLSSPSNDREWSRDQTLLPVPIIKGHTVKIKNIRNFAYSSESDYDVRYYDKVFNMDDLVSVDYIVEPFGGVGAAHTFLSFGFDDGSQVAISVEIRKEVGESFSPLKGLIRAFEIMYVIADERDVIKLRTNFRRNTVYLYPVVIPRSDMRKLFVDMLSRAKALTQKPEFYNTLTNTCTTNIVRHVNTIAPNAIPWDLRLLLPKNSDALAYELGLLDQSISLDEARDRYQINERAVKYADDPNFSARIRQLDE